MAAKLGALIDQAYTIRAKRLELEKKVDDLKAKQKQIEDEILEGFNKSEIDGAKGSLATASITRVTVPTVTDFGAFADYILKTKQLDLLERRPSRSACQERWKDGQTLPGVEPFEKVGVSLNKTGTKEK
jgi:hypothetical protein